MSRQQPSDGALASADPALESAVLPLGSRTNERGHLEVGGCDVVELASEFGTPAYIYAVDDIRSRARAYIEALRARSDDFELLYASKALPISAAYSLAAQEGLSVDVASGGELHLALSAGFEPGRIYMHGNNKSAAELSYAEQAGVGYLVLDSFDEIDRCEELLGARMDALLRITPGVEAATHESVKTGAPDSKFGFGLTDGVAEQAIEAVLGAKRLNLVGLHAHIGSQLFDLEPHALSIKVLGELASPEWCRIINAGGGLGIAYVSEDRPPSIESYVDRVVRAVRDAIPGSPRIALEPGRSLVGNAGITAYTIGTIKEIRGVRTYVAVDGGMSDNLRPMLYDARYEALLANRPEAERDTLVTLAGMHCESGDILARDVRIPAPALGDILVTPATGAYGYALANNYNGVPRPPVIFCSDGDPRLVVRRETYDDLRARDA